MNNSIIGVLSIVLLGSCASTPSPRPQPAATEPTGEFETPSSVCSDQMEAVTSWDIVEGYLQPGEHVVAVEDVGADRLAVRADDGKRARTIWFRKYGDGGLEEASPP